MLSVSQVLFRHRDDKKAGQGRDAISETQHLANQGVG